jgi:predicted transcriptional regulator
LLDVADFISETALICQELPVDLGIADSFIAEGDTVTYSLGASVVGTSRRL